MVKLIAAHQPNFLPWLGFFDKMMKADTFVLVDHVQFEKQGFQNRTQIKTGEGPRWVTVPVHHGSRDERVMDKLIDNTGVGHHEWGHRIKGTLKCAYQGAPYYNEYIIPFIEVLSAKWERLIDLNMKMLELSRQALDIKTPILMTSEMNIAGNKLEMVLNICRALGAQTYLSGSGGSKNYLVDSAFEAVGIHIQWQEFSHPRYLQHPGSGTFMERMSIVDLLANCGPNSRAVLEGAVLGRNFDAQK